MDSDPAIRVVVVLKLLQCRSEEFCLPFPVPWFRHSRPVVRPTSTICDLNRFLRAVRCCHFSPNRAQTCTLAHDFGKFLASIVSLLPHHCHRPCFPFKTGKFVGTPVVRRPRWVNIVLRCRGNSVRRRSLQPRRQIRFPDLCRRRYLRLVNPSSRLGNLEGNPISSSVGSNSVSFSFTC